MTLLLISSGKLEIKYTIWLLLYLYILSAMHEKIKIIFAIIQHEPIYEI